MHCDPIEAAGLVTREVRDGDRCGTPTKVIVARRTYQTDQVDLWDALTNPERLPRWFAPVTGAFELGGRFTVAGSASGVVERCDEPALLALTWEYEGSTSWVTITLTPDRDATVLEVVHEAPREPNADFYAQFGPGAGGVGWDLALLCLGVHLLTGAPVEDETSEEWPRSVEGRAFVTAAATGWEAEAVRAGDAVGDARAAAARTIDFYTSASTANAE